MEIDVNFGPPTDGGWTSETRWWRPFNCVCGYQGKEYWKEHGENTLVCTKCGVGRRAVTDEATEND